MKQYLSLVFINVFLLFGCSKASSETDPFVVIKPNTNEKPVVSEPMKGICVFAGQADVFTDADWQALASSSLTDFIIIPKDAASYGSTGAGYKSQLGPFMIKVINQLVSRKSTAKIWIGTPGISSKNSTISGNSLEPIYDYLCYVRDQIGPSIWDNNVGGVYMNMEAIYGTVDYSNIISNACVKLISDLSSRIHKNLNTRFLWIPYYGYGLDPGPEELIKRIAYVSHKNTIFDFVVIQPHYYFDSAIEVNLSGVKHSVSKQAICYRDGTIVTPKISKTVIGAEMELDWHVVPPNNYTEQFKRYSEYIAAFKEFKGIYPIIFYWDGTLQNALNSRIIPFFQ